MISRKTVLSLAIAVFLAAASLLADAPAQSPLLSAMQLELERSFSRLKQEGETPLYFLGYRVYDTETVDLTASYGAI